MASSDETAGSGKRRREDDDEAANPDAALALLRSLRAEAGSSYPAALTTVSTILTNVLEKPEEPKFRTLRLGNPNFHSRLGGFPSGVPLLRVFGWQEASGTDAAAEGATAPTHLALPVAEAELLARALVLVEAARQADAQVCNESSSGGCGGGGGGGGGGGSSSAPPAAAARSGTASGKRRALDASAAASGGAAAEAATAPVAGAGADAPLSFELDEYGAAALDAFFTRLVGEGAVGVQGLGEEAFCSLAAAAEDALAVTGATGDAAAHARATHWLAALHQQGEALGWTAEREGEEAEDDEDGGAGAGAGAGLGGAAGAAGAAAAPAAGGGATGADDERFDVGEDGNFDACTQCGQGGELICCEACPQAYHPACLGELAPHPDDDSDWYCPQCADALGMGGSSSS